MKKPTTTFYLIYARVSPKGSQWTGQETSIPVQIKECKEFVLRRDATAQFIEITDEFKSGKNLRRAGIQRIIDDLQTVATGQKWDCLVVWSLDRLTHSLVDALPLFETIHAAGRGLISVRQSIDMFSAGGRLQLQMMICFAEYERSMLSERVSASMRNIAEAGKIPFGVLPLGYRRKKGAWNTVEVVPADAEIVRYIYAQYLAGNLSFADLHQRYPGKVKSRQVLYNLLRNPIYIGKFRYGGKILTGEHPAIIGENDFVQTQERLQMNVADKKIPQARPGAQKYAYLLQGVIHCHCGHFMTPYSAHSKNGTAYYYYKCTDPLCKHAINAEKIDNAVVKRVCQLASDDEYMSGIALAYYDEQERTRQAALPQLAELKTRLREWREKREAVERLFLQDVVTAENRGYWNDILTEANDESKRLDREIKWLKQPGKPSPDMFGMLVEAVKEWAQQLEVMPDNVDWRRSLVGSFIDRVRCVDKTHYEIKAFMTNGQEWLPEFNSLAFRWSFVFQLELPTNNAPFRHTPHRYSA